MHAYPQIVYAKDKGLFDFRQKSLILDKIINDVGIFQQESLAPIMSTNFLNFYDECFIQLF